MARVPRPRKRHVHDVADRRRRTVGHQDEPIGKIERLVDVMRHHDHHPPRLASQTRSSVSCSSKRVSESSWENGSSSSRNRGSSDSARTSDTHCCVPSESDAGSLIGGVGDCRPGRGSARPPASASRRAVLPSRELDVLAGRQPWQQARRLEHDRAVGLGSLISVAVDRSRRQGSRARARRSSTAPSTCRSRSGRGCRRTRRACISTQTSLTATNGPVGVSNILVRPGQLERHAHDSPPALDAPTDDRRLGGGPRLRARPCGRGRGWSAPRPPTTAPAPRRDLRATASACVAAADRREWRRQSSRAVRASARQSDRPAESPRRRCW